MFLLFSGVVSVVGFDPGRGVNQSDAEAIEVLKQWYQSKGPAFFEHVRLKNMGMNWRDVVIAEAYVDFTIGEATLVTYPLAIYPRIELKAA